MKWSALIPAISIPLLAAILGNAFIPASAMTWYGQIIHPWFKLPLWGSVIVALLVYVGYGTIIFRTLCRRQYLAVTLAATVVVGNELWNLVFFGTQEFELTFWATVLFAVLVLFQTLSVRRLDRVSLTISLVYLAWVVLYDLSWMLQLWQVNR